MNKIFIIEDEVIVARSMEKILVDNGYEVVNIASNYDDAKKKILVTNPDLILCDINLNGENSGIDLMKELEPRYNVPFIFISAYSDKKTLNEANKIGPCNYITKPFSERQLLVSLERVFIQLKSKLAEQPTKRELGILKLISKGYSTKQIASQLNISFNTVESHRKNMMRKYNISSMPELVCLATSKGWISYEA